MASVWIKAALVCAAALAVGVGALPAHRALVRPRVPVSTYVPTPSFDLTVYINTPRNYTDVTNQNTGDAPGDVFFGLYEKSYPIVCANDSQIINCKNIPILNIPNFNVYNKFVVTIDPKLGEYNMCNPNPDTGVFACKPDQQICWSQIPGIADSFKDICDPNQCECDAVSLLSVGAEQPPMGRGGNSSAPSNCPNYFPSPATSLNGTVLASRVVDNAGECCDWCNKEVLCVGYTVPSSSADPITCKLFTFVRPPYTFPDTATNAFFKSHANPFFQKIGALNGILNGTWFSTQAPGMCAEGQTTGCWWRLKELVAQKNATCVNENVINAVIAKNPDCWKGCGADARNESSPCWVNCLYDTMVGNSTAGIPPMTRDEIVQPFERSFLSNDTTQGGCPEEPPCPTTPCKPTELSEGEAEASRLYLQARSAMRNILWEMHRRFGL